MLLCSVLLFALPLLCACQTLQKFSSFLRGAVRTPPPPPQLRKLFSRPRAQERERAKVGDAAAGGEGRRKGKEGGQTTFHAEMERDAFPPPPPQRSFRPLLSTSVAACLPERASAKEGGEGGVTFLSLSFGGGFRLCLLLFCLWMRVGLRKEL